MKGDFNRFKLIALLIFTSLFVFHTVSAAGIAVTPSLINISDAARSIEYEKTITVFNPGNDELMADIMISGDAKEWIKIYEDTPDAGEPVNEIKIPGKNIKVKARISVPEDTANGMYRAEINFDTKSPESSENTEVGAVLKVRATTKVEIDVTGTEIISGEADLLRISDSEVNYPVPVEIMFQNTGNVVLAPGITIVISKEGKNIDTVRKTASEIKPGEKEKITVNWENNGLESGDYSAIVTVNIGDNEILREETKFSLIPEGTLTRKGEFTEINYEGKTVVGRILKISGTFVNTGEIPTKAVLKGEIYKDDELIDTFESDELTVTAMGTENLVYYYKPEISGEYKIITYIVYEDKKTGEKELNIQVTGSADSTGDSSKPTESGKAPLPTALVIAALTIFALVMALKSAFRK
ncbi:COG1470 family protein [Methanoplanus limicola]|uniref:Uncharacterized protein n=1 Tax=Methanoplanus limicola DSM 2279 TaxID=937775 RepID=H1YZQ3_9EURY|nr:hypothetical protein [Methanoplanus limicola]EHQ34315.1 hypothetical protein Metlim_0162 [Methanoplanus limicola DSM 2279]